VIIAFSTSSPLASVALLSDEGALIAARAEDARMNASGVCLRLLQDLLDETGLHKSGATLFLADLGPGSFTGVKVGVTLAKTMGMALGGRVGGASAFDLISPTGTVILPCKRGEFFLRDPGGHISTVTELPSHAFTGYGQGIEPATYPLAEGFERIFDRIHPCAPEVLVPEYHLEPSISTPNKPYRGAQVGK
jgi:tRNA threonylcarbamoyladenosine biosynthesis protein TsaB